jgi:CubicO group peptidase (beta-lactamase class C family)
MANSGGSMHRSLVRAVVFAGVAVAITSHSAIAQSTGERVERMLRSLPRFGQGVDTSQRYTIEQEMARLHVPGASIAVVVDGRIVMARGFGVKEFGKPERVDTGTVFLAGSISKPIFATGALALVEGGTLALDRDVNDYLTSWDVPASKYTEMRKVTLRRLLSHSAGLTVWGFPGYHVDSTVPTVPQILDGVPPANTAAVRSDTQPAARWMYSGGGYTIAQLAVTDATNEPFPALLQRIVLGPMRMSRSSYENPIASRLAGNAASAHERPDTVVSGRWHVYPEMAAAGLWTTASDLARWGIAITEAYHGATGGVLSPAMAREMVRPQIGLPATGRGASPPGNWHGLGPALRGSGRDFVLSHNGRAEGFIATALFYPERRIGIVVMTNGTSGEFLNQLSIAFAREFTRDLAR